jgi:uncharacterized protein YbbC (DUF1343 family)
MKIANGVDTLLLNTRPLLGRKWGMLTNDAAKCSDGRPSRLALMQAGINLCVLYAPEHGLQAKGADGTAQPDQTDTLTQLPVKSLYAESGWMPNLGSADTPDGIIVDMPDIGCRFYTYLWSLTYALEACGLFGKTLVVLDRPNPTGGHLDRSEGPWLDEENCSSFIGRWNIPIRHGCTLGELARYFNETRKIGAELIVVPATGWKGRNSFFSRPHLFHATSPAISDIETAMIYPGTCLFEGLNLNEGRGTAKPFRSLCAPWLDTAKWLKCMDPSAFGIDCQLFSCVPKAGRYAGEKCLGLQFHLTNEAQLWPVGFGIMLIQSLMQSHAGCLSEALYPTLANPSGHHHLDLLLGITNSFQKIFDGQLPHLKVGETWQNRVENALIYF